MMLIVLFVAVFLMMFAPEGQREKQRGQRYRGKTLQALHFAL